MDPLANRTLGQTDVRVSQLGFGGATLGDMQGVTPEAQASATVEAAYAAGITYFDTAPWYGNGKSEHRLGHVLRQKPRASYVLSTKIGRVFFRPAAGPAFEPPGWVGGLPFDFRFDYSRDGVLRSYEDSVQRLGINTVDALLIHDLDLMHFGTDEGVAARLHELENGGIQALQELKRNGEIGAIGAGINHVGMIPQFLERFDLDFFIVAMPYTLLDQDALDRELPLCASRGVSIVIGAVFASGILAVGPDGPARYGYRPAEPATVEKTRQIAAVCQAHGVPLGAAALQFPLAHPAVASVIPGPNSPEQARQNVAWMQTPIPAALWPALKAEGLLRADAPVPA